MIYHVTTQKNWENALQQGFYETTSLAAEGFIHCSTKEQVPGVLLRYYAGVRHLMLLHIEENKLTALLKYETGTNGELFPHVLGPINKDAIVIVENL